MVNYEVKCELSISTSFKSDLNVQTLQAKPNYRKLFLKLQRILIWLLYKAAVSLTINGQLISKSVPLKYLVNCPYSMPTNSYSLIRTILLRTMQWWQ